MPNLLLASCHCASSAAVSVCRICDVDQWLLGGILHSDNKINTTFSTDAEVGEVTATKITPLQAMDRYLLTPFLAFSEPSEAYGFVSI